MMIMRLPLFLVAFLFALLAGYKVGEKIDPWDDVFSRQRETISQPAVRIPQNNQYNFLIIAIDDMKKPDSQLESIWLAAQVENSSNITLVPVFPAKENPDFNNTLSESFRLDGNKPVKEFWDAMKKINIWWKGYIISDYQTSKKLIDEVGGIEIQGQYLNGKQTLGIAISWKNNTEIAIHQQKIFLEGICNQLAEIERPNLKEVIGVINQDLITSKGTETFLEKRIIDASGNTKLTCTFPTFSQVTSKSTQISP